jgi:hypothetical protein
MSKDAIRPADNIKLAEIELNIERGGKTMLEDVQSLIERIKADEKKIRQREKEINDHHRHMDGIYRDHLDRG